jgi:hypothetical protein
MRSSCAQPRKPSPSAGNSPPPTPTTTAPTSHSAEQHRDLFSRLGRPADALPSAQEAVTVYRQLATANPDRYRRPDLAHLRPNLSDIFLALKRTAEADEARQEATLIREDSQHI